MRRKQVVSAKTRLFRRLQVIKNKGKARQTASESGQGHPQATAGPVRPAGRSPPHRRRPPRPRAAPWTAALLRRSAPSLIFPPTSVPPHEHPTTRVCQSSRGLEHSRAAGAAIQATAFPVAYGRPGKRGSFRREHRRGRKGACPAEDLTPRVKLALCRLAPPRLGTADGTLIRR